MYEAILRVGDPNAPVSTDDHDVRVELWCNERCDLVRLVGSDAGAAAAEVADAVGIAERARQGDELVVVTDRCLAVHRPNNVERYVGRYGCLLLPPLRYDGGDRVCRLLALDPGALRDVYRDLLDDSYAVSVESKRSVDAVTGGEPLLDPEGLVPDLTARQREVLLTAIEEGYYEIPRGITTDGLATTVGVERRTAEDHLRRAERKLVEAMAVYL